MQNARFFFAMLTAAGTSLFSQCADTRINEAFQSAWQRRPTAAECNGARYAQGDYRATSDLIPLVKAAMVCQDPWIAQAYYRLGRRLNNHDPLQLDGVSTTYFSTKGDCDPSQYGSWSSFEQLKGLVVNPPRKLAVVPAPAPAPAGISVVMAGRTFQLNPKGPILTPAGQLIDMSRGVVNDLQNHCYFDKDGVLRTVPLVSTNGGNVVAAGAGNVVAAGAGNVVAAGAGNVISVVAGRVVAAGAGNVVAAGAGNVVAQGAGNWKATPTFQLATAPDRTIRGLSSDGYLIDSWGIRVLHAGAGVTMQRGVLVNLSQKGILTSTGANIVSHDGGTLQVMKVDPGKVDLVIAGKLDVSALFDAGPAVLVNPGAIGNIAAISPSQLISVQQNPGYSLQQLSYSTSSFSPASTSWRNKTAQSFSWRSSGTGQVMVRLLLAGRSYDLCPAVSVTANGCQVQPVDWSLAIRSASNATLSLVDAKSGRALANTNVMIAVP